MLLFFRGNNEIEVLLLYQPPPTSVSLFSAYSGFLFPHPHFLFRNQGNDRDDFTSRGRADSGTVVFTSFLGLTHSVLPGFYCYSAHCLLCPEIRFDAKGAKIS